jgi:hypothetical protein
VRAALSWLFVQLCGVVALLSGAAVLLWGSWHLLAGIAVSYTEETAAFYRRALPEEVGVTSLIVRGTDVSPFEVPFMLLIPVRRKVCGGVAFGLSEATRADLARDGLATLEQAPVGRGYRGTPQEHFYTYDPWQQTPVPASWTSEGMWRGLDCLSEHWPAAAQVLDEARRPGSYFTEKSHGRLLVVPGLNLVVMTYDQ